MLIFKKAPLHVTKPNPHAALAPRAESPALGFVLAALLMALYHLTDRRYDELLQDIAARRAQTVAAGD